MAEMASSLSLSTAGSDCFQRRYRAALVHQNHSVPRFSSRLHNEEKTGYYLIPDNSNAGFFVWTSL